MEKKGYVASTWNMNSERPRKVYALTEQGKSLLNITENSLLMMCQKINPQLTEKVQIQIKPMIVAQ
jgi:DNA-binding PadR family transcriptional regulator